MIGPIILCKRARYGPVKTGDLGDNRRNRRLHELGELKLQGGSSPSVQTGRRPTMANSTFPSN